MCIEPSKLVCPTLAVLFAGRCTSLLMRMVTSACQFCTSILVTLPTFTSATRTRVFCWMTTTSGNWAWMVYEPSPLRSEEHTSELQSRRELVCRLLLEKKQERWSDPSGAGRGSSE